MTRYIYALQRISGTPPDSTTRIWDSARTANLRLLNLRHVKDYWAGSFIIHTELVNSSRPNTTPGGRAATSGPWA